MERLAAELPALDPALMRGPYGLAVERWQRTTTPAPGDLPYEPEGEIETLLDEVARAAGISFRRSASLRCAAAELARFVGARGDLPFEWLRRHVLGACGSVLAHASARTLRVGASLDEARFVSGGRSRVEETLRSALAPERVMATAFFRGPRQTNLVVVFAEPGPLTLEPWQGPDANGIVHLRGFASDDIGDLRAYITRGSHGAALCNVDRNLREIAIACPLAEADAAAEVEVFGSHGDLLLRQVALLSVERTPGATPPFVSSPVGEAPSLSPETVLAAVNTARETAGLPPLTLSPGASAIHQRFAAPLFGATMHGGSQPTLDRVVLGLQAGHGVEDVLVRDATTTWSITPGPEAQDGIIARLLARPAGRLTLLQPDPGLLAVGILASTDPPYAAIVATGYSISDDADRERDADRVFARLVEARAIRGLAPPRRIAELPSLTRAARRVENGELTPDRALAEAMPADLPLVGPGARTMTSRTLALDRFLLPPPLVAPELTVGIVVARTPVEGSRWSQYIIYFVVS